ncbi:MAG: FAD-dependent oxidoreductase [Clostridia bacterium]|nr:FAD-dependent oxidoreductase [Clostridia bacterium]
MGDGEHRTGEPPSYKYTYGDLENIAKLHYPDCEFLFHWNSRDCISLDKLPYIGNYSALKPNMYIATGFKKWGMSLSNISANIIVDNILGKENKYSYLFNPNRLKPFKNADEFKNMITQSTNSLFLNKLRPQQLSFDDISLNSGSIVEINNEKIGIYKNNDGKIFAVKPICTHLGCLLSWNDVDKTWDCPCHGSRFNYEGKNIYDPAFKDLETYDLT